MINVVRWLLTNLKCRIIGRRQVLFSQRKRFQNENKKCNTIRWIQLSIIITTPSKTAIEFLFFENQTYKWLELWVLGSGSCLNFHEKPGLMYSGSWYKQEHVVITLALVIGLIVLGFFWSGESAIAWEDLGTGLAQKSMLAPKFSHGSLMHFMNSRDRPRSPIVTTRNQRCTILHSHSLLYSSAFRNLRHFYLGVACPHWI